MSTAFYNNEQIPRYTGTKKKHVYIYQLDKLCNTNTK